MADITPQMVKDLREKTGAGMADCKKALTEANGDIQGAIEYLRKKGAASAAKRAEKTAKEGRIFVRTTDDCKVGVIMEVNCETDFVALNESFVNYVDTLGNIVLQGDFCCTETLMKTNNADINVEEMTNDLLAKFSEKIDVRRFEKVKTDGYVITYLHATNNKLGVLMEIDAPNMTPKASDMLKDITMQIAAMRPSFIDRSQVDQKTLEKEVEIYKVQAMESGKKEEIAEKIAQGRLEKFYAESCLLEQQFVKDSKKTVNDIINEVAQEVGGNVKINKFMRFALGEEL